MTMPLTIVLGKTTTMLVPRACNHQPLAYASMKTQANPDAWIVARDNENDGPTLHAINKVGASWDKEGNRTIEIASKALK